MFKILKISRNFTKLNDTYRNTIKNVLNINNYKYMCTLQTLKIEGINEAIDIQSLTNGVPEIEKKLRVITLEVDVLRQDGQQAPDSLNIKAAQWQELLAKNSRSQRLKYLKFLWKLEKKRENFKKKQEVSRIERENRPDYINDGHIRYGLGHNTFLIRIYDNTINQLYNANLIRAMHFGQKLVVDCGYDEQMTSRESLNAAKQLMLMFADNRIHDDPFDLHLCNTNFEKTTMKALHRHIPNMLEDSFPLNIHSKSYLDLFPKHNLVYLTPHCREVLHEFDHDAVYIIGAIVDKVNNEPLSLAKAKMEGLKMAKLPLDNHLQWGSGSGKNLTLNHMIRILLDIRASNNWEYALRHVPRRKIVDMSVTMEEDRYSMPYDKTPTWKAKKRRTETDFIKRIMNE